MKLKKPNETPHVGFTFLFVSEKTGTEILVKGANSVSQLTTKAAEMMRKAGMTIPDNLEKIVEHQICLRSPFPQEECWMGGIGDKLHHKWIKPVLQKTAAAVEKKGRIGRAIAKVAKKIGGCGGCAGTKVYKQGVNNLGRAGTLNRVISKS